MSPEAIKQELLASIIEIADEEDYSVLNREVKNAKEPKDGIFSINKYEKLLQGENRKFINIVGKQGELLIFISRYVYINFFVKYTVMKESLLPRSILRIILS